MRNLKLYNQIKVYRAKRNMTQLELAGKVGVTRKTINVIEAGNYSPSVTLALAIADALEAPIHELFNIQNQNSA